MSQFKNFNVTVNSNGVTTVEINRPRKHNSFTEEAWEEYYSVFEYLSSATSTRVVVLYGTGKHFCAGIDLSAIKGTFTNQNSSPNGILRFQKCINAPVEFDIPVISVSHGVTYGLAIDIISATTIRVASKDARFSIKEIDVGIMADIGSLERLPFVVGNVSLLNELALTARDFNAEEAKELGLLSHLLSDKEEALKKAYEIAELISSKFLPAVKGTKKHLELMTTNSDTARKGLVEVAKDNSELMAGDDYKKFFLKQFSKLLSKL